jgi:hypothetical protein
MNTIYCVSDMDPYICPNTPYICNSGLLILFNSMMYIYCTSGVLEYVQQLLLLVGYTCVTLVVLVYSEYNLA